MSTHRQPDHCPPEEGLDALAFSRVRAQRREHIIEAARRAFLRDGYRGATMDRVADEAGVSKQTLYNYFEDKDALLAALLDHWSKDLAMLRVRQAVGVLDGSLESVAGLRGALEGILHKGDAADPAAVFRLMFELAGLRPSLSERAREAMLPYSADALRDVIASAVAEGRLRPVDPDVAAAAILDLVSACNVLQPLIYGERWHEFTPERMAAGLADLLAHGLLPRP